MELSILETKIRKKIMLINSDPRNMLKKLRNIDILRRFIINPRQNYRKMGRKDTIKNRREVDNEMRLSKEEIVDERGT